MRKAEAIVFDLDDTLYPEREYVFSAYRAVAKWIERHLGTAATEALFCFTVKGTN